MRFFEKDNFFMRIGFTGLMLIFGIFSLYNDSKENTFLKVSVGIIAFLFLANVYLMLRSKYGKK